MNVKAKSYRHVALYEPGEWTAVLKYNGGSQTVAKWTVLPLSEKRLAKNVILFVGDGMAPAMVTAARLLGHKTVNGQYQTKLMLDSPESFGMQVRSPSWLDLRGRALTPQHDHNTDDPQSR